MSFDVQARVSIGGGPSDDLPLILTRPTIQGILAELIDATPAGGVLSGTVTAHAMANSLLFTPFTVIGDLVESTFPGYAATALVAWSAVGLDPSGNVIVFADLSTPFICTGDPLGEVVGGVYLTAGGVLLGGVAIDPAIVLVDGSLIPASFILQIGNR